MASASAGAQYLKPQLRFRHLFEPVRDEATLKAIQNRVKSYWENVDLDKESAAFENAKTRETLNHFEETL